MEPTKGGMMEQYLKALADFNINLTSESMVEIARYWFWREIIPDTVGRILATIFLGSLILMVFTVIKKFGTKEWE